MGCRDKHQFDTRLPKFQGRVCHKLYITQYLNQPVIIYIKQCTLNKFPVFISNRESSTDSLKRVVYNSDQLMQISMAPDPWVPTAFELCASSKRNATQFPWYKKPHNLYLKRVQYQLITTEDEIFIELKSIKSLRNTKKTRDGTKT